jgi:serine/threonine-protein kinase
MLTGIKVGIIFTAIAAATVTALAPVHAAPLPLDASYFADGDDLGVVKDIYMNIPVDNTTQSVAGGAVRYYDVAIAQAVTITHRLCPSRDEQGATLYLTAGKQGQINMGKFYISCNLAHDLVSAYGLNEDVVRPIRGYAGAIEYIPSLNLDTDAKARRFVSFSSNFKPVGR